MVTEFTALYRDHARDLHRFALFLCGEPALADDIVAETFVRVWSARERVDFATVRGYLFTIARNLFLHERRRKRPVALDDNVHVDPRPSPETEAIARAELSTVLVVLQRLPEIDRAALLLHVEGGLPYREIAAALGITEIAARAKVHRARLKLSAARGESRTAPSEPENRR
jgi:RNA polymerase sigma-70 factor (ECF subfamily)